MQRPEWWKRQRGQASKDSSPKTHTAHGEWIERWSLEPKSIYFDTAHAFASSSSSFAYEKPAAELYLKNCSALCWQECAWNAWKMGVEDKIASSDHSPKQPAIGKWALSLLWSHALFFNIFSKPNRPQCFTHSQGAWIARGSIPSSTWYRSTCSNTKRGNESSSVSDLKCLAWKNDFFRRAFLKSGYST